jgi:hypothetical protein
MNFIDSLQIDNVQKEIQSILICNLFRGIVQEKEKCHIGSGWETGDKLTLLSPSILWQMPKKGNKGKMPTNT